jgi:NAD(P)-dependent dehydrogenase (short-subunit alcohol dehydrogenase family)
MNLFDLSGKTAIVTGGGKGIGRQMADGLAEAGANVVLCARDAARCEEAAAELEQLGVRTLGLGCDVRDSEQVQAVVERTVADFGGVDILVNNAGTVWGASPEDMPWARHGIRANAIAPGWFPSDMANFVLNRHGDEVLGHIPLGRFGGPEDLKGVVVFLASPASAYVTGHTLVVDGGQSAW